MTTITCSTVVYIYYTQPSPPRPTRCKASVDASSYNLRPGMRVELLASSELDHPLPENGACAFDWYLTVRHKTVHLAGAVVHLLKGARRAEAKRYVVIPDLKLPPGRYLAALKVVATWGWGYGYILRSEASKSVTY